MPQQQAYSLTLAANTPVTQNLIIEMTERAALTVARFFHQSG